MLPLLSLTLKDMEMLLGCLLNTSGRLTPDHLTLAANFLGLNLTYSYFTSMCTSRFLTGSSNKQFLYY